MTLFGPLSRATVLGAVLVASTLLPAFADSPEMTVLASYIGTWSGKGTLKGDQKEDVTCKMQLVKGNGDKINYNGRCSLAGAQIAIYGTIAWVADKHHYEAAMTSGIGGFNGVAIGQRQGSNVVFDLQQRANDNEGNDVSISSTVLLSGPSISVDFHATFNKTGYKVDASIPFSKAS